MTTYLVISHTGIDVQVDLRALVGLLKVTVYSLQTTAEGEPARDADGNYAIIVNGDPSVMAISIIVSLAAQCHFKHIRTSHSRQITANAA